jgi:prephenate dehydrogenase
MEHPESLQKARVAILGLGLMGGSLALGLKRHCLSLVAYDPDLQTLALARQREIVDRVSDDLIEILDGANLVILAAPVGAILKLLASLPEIKKSGAVVLDIGSSKVQIVRAMQALPERFDPIGGHPMCGKEVGSLVNADASIFNQAPFAFTPLVRTSARARAIAEQIAGAVGSHSLWLSAEVHDQWTAATSHLPYLVSAALAAATPAEAAPMVGPGFRSSTRLAASPTLMMADVLATNRENILTALERFRQQLALLDENLREGTIESLVDYLNRAAAQRAEFNQVVF